MPGDAKTAMDDRCDVMMVDDDELALLVVTRRLSGTGLALETRSEPTAALEWLRTGRTRLLLVDLHMESIDGVELLETLHAEGRLAATRAFLCSAARPDATTAGRVEGLGAGVLLKETVLASGGVERLLTGD